MDDKILIVTPNFYPENFVINELADHWIKIGKTVEVLTQIPSYPFDKVYDGYKNKVFSKEEYNCIKIFRFRTILGYKNSFKLKFYNYVNFVIFSIIYAIIKGYKYDKIFYYHTGSLTMALSSFIYKHIYRKKQYIWTQDLWPYTVFESGIKKTKFKEFFFKALTKLIYNKINIIFISSNGFSPVINKFLKDKKCIFIPNWPLKKIHKCASKNKKNKFCFLFAGNLGVNQNLENIIKAFAAIENENAVLEIIGDGSCFNVLKELIAQSGVKNINLRGYYPLDEMDIWYSKADVLIISMVNKPALSRTIPGKFQVYLTANKPIFSIVNGEVSKLVRQNAIGLSAIPDNIDDIKNKFEKFIEMDENQLAILGNNAKKLMPKYEFNNTVKKIDELLFH